MLAKATKILAVVMPLLLIFIGSLKLYPIIPAVFQEMQTKFSTYSPVCPTVLVGYVPDPHTYRIVVAVVEILAGLGALLGSLDVKRMSCFLHIVIMCGAVLTLVLTHEYTETVTPIVFGLIWLHLYIHYGQKVKQD